MCPIGTRPVVRLILPPRTHSTECMFFFLARTKLEKGTFGSVQRTDMHVQSKQKGPPLRTRVRFSDDLLSVRFKTIPRVSRDVLILLRNIILFRRQNKTTVQ